MLGFLAAIAFILYLFTKEKSVMADARRTVAPYYKEKYGKYYYDNKLHSPYVKGEIIYDEFGDGIIENYYLAARDNHNQWSHLGGADKILKIAKEGRYSFDEKTREMLKMWGKFKEELSPYDMGFNKKIVFNGKEVLFSKFEKKLRSRLSCNFGFEYDFPEKFLIKLYNEQKNNYKDSYTFSFVEEEYHKHIYQIPSFVKEDL